MKGIDVSKHQGKIDWKKVKEDGVQFAIIRAGFGMYQNQEDPYFKLNLKGALECGIAVGVYWYSYAASCYEAKKEAQVCLDIIKKNHSDISLPVFFDQEYEPAIKALTDKVRTDICIAFMEEIKAAGFRTGLYCSYDWYQNYVEKSRLLSYPVWIAQYGAKCQYTGKNLVMWQYSSSGRVKGISGNVDLNAGYTGLFPSENQNGWVLINENWYWKKNGAFVKSQWVYDGKYWYYLDSTGKMLTGIQEINHKFYYLNDRTRSGVPKGAAIITDQSGAIKQV